MSATRRSRFAPTAGQLQIAGLIIVWLGFWLRLHSLGADSFWIDEILTVWRVRTGPDAYLAIRDHPPFMYTTVALALRAFGESEFAARLPSLFAGTLALPLTVLLGKSLRRPMAGLWAALLLAVSPVHISHVQEARHYAWLLTLTLVTYILVIRALRKPRRSLWIAFALVTVWNLYTHYAALIVLSSQALWICLWLLWRRRETGPLWRPLLAAGLLIVLLYLPWVNRLPAVIDYNLGPDAVTPTGGIVSLSQWAGLLFNAFGMYRGWLPHVLLLLVLTGLATLIFRREWSHLALLVSGTVLPLLLIRLLQASRGAHPRFVLFMLPFYLLAAAIGVTTVLAQLVGRRRGRRAYLSAAALAAGLLLLVAWPGVAAEHQRVQEDWRGILGYLDRVAPDDAVLIGASMNVRHEFNLVAASLPYYLERGDHDYTLLAANSFDLDQARSLARRQAPVWLIAFDWQTPTALANSELEIVPFQTALFAGRDPAQSGTSLERAIALYRQLTTVVAEPQQSCLFHEDLVTLWAAGQEPDRALAALEAVKSSCPEYGNRPRLLAAEQAALRQKLSQLLAAGLESEAVAAASRLRQLDRTDPGALAFLTVFDLIARHNAGQAIIQDAAAPEPVRVVTFDIPGQGEAGDVLFIHPPATVSYRLQLPDMPVALTARVAMAPESWDWGGDGATFVVYVQAPDGDERELWRRTLDAGSRRRGWHEVSVSLADFAGQDVRLTLATEAGPAGDTTGDWAGWETPRIVRAPAPTR